MEKQDILEPDCFYHIFNRGNNKENLFIDYAEYPGYKIGTPSIFRLE